MSSLRRAPGRALPRGFAWRRTGPSRFQLSRAIKFANRAKAMERVPSKRRSQAIPPSQTVTMKYYQQFGLTNTLGVLATQSFRLNSIFDPDFTGAGHQPYGHDTYASLYNRYRVKSVKYRLSVGLNSAASNFLVVLPSNNTAPGSISLAGETDGARTRLVVPNQMETITGTIDLANLDGVPKDEYQDDDRFQAAMGSNPVESLSLHVQTGRDDATTTGMLCSMELWYTVELFDALQLAQS